MGKEIEQVALQRGHKIVSVIDIGNREDFESEAFKNADVAIEFTAPQAALDNFRCTFAAGVKLVSGTTGWLEHIDEIKEACRNGNTLFWASNFSLGVNIFFAVNKYVAKIMNEFPSYNVMMEEVHHIHKLDAPSGTAITLAEGILENIDRKTKWVQEDAHNADELPVYSIREGEVPGIHSIMYESEVDSIVMTHESKNRKGLALGAVLAAEFTATRNGFLGMNDMLKF